MLFWREYHACEKSAGVDPRDWKPCADYKIQRLVFSWRFNVECVPCSHIQTAKSSLANDLKLSHGHRRLAHAYDLDCQISYLNQNHTFRAAAQRSRTGRWPPARDLSELAPRCSPFTYLHFLAELSVVLDHYFGLVTGGCQSRCQ